MSKSLYARPNKDTHRHSRRHLVELTLQHIFCFQQSMLILNQTKEKAEAKMSKHQLLCQEIQMNLMAFHVHQILLNNGENIKS